MVSYNGMVFTVVVNQKCILTTKPVKFCHKLLVKWIAITTDEEIVFFS